MSEEEKSKKEPDKNKLVLKLGEDDSALVVRTNGEIELISRDLQGKEDNYLGDLEDLNKTFTLVLAFAAALENEQLISYTNSMSCLVEIQCNNEGKKKKKSVFFVTNPEFQQDKTH